MAHTAHEGYTPLFSKRLYDRLKYVALVLLPALSALYFGLGEIWNLPKVTEVIGTIAVLDTVLGMILRNDSVRYQNSDARFDGHVDVIENDEGDKEYDLKVHGDPAEVLEAQREVVLKVSKDETPVENVAVIPSPKPAPRKRAPRKKPAPVDDPQELA